MKHFFAFLILAGGTAALAADKCEAPVNSVRKILQVRYLSPYPVAELAKGLGLCVTADGNAGLVAVSGPATAVKELEDTLKKLDVAKPNKQVELIGYIVVADGDLGTAPPPTLAPVIEQLRQTFPFKDYKVLDTIIARMGGGRETDLSGDLPNAPGQKTRPTSYRFLAGLRDVASGQVSFNTIMLNLQYAQSRLSIQTSTSIRDGQTVVIGKATGSGGAEAYFLVLTVRLVD
jgi:hypothetical protein